MVAFSTIALVAGVTASAGSAGFNIFEGRKKEKEAERRFEETAAARRRAIQLQAKRDKLINTRTTARAFAERRRLTSQGVQQAINQGAGGAIGATGSTIPGLTGNLQNQFNLNTAFNTQVTEVNQGIRTAFDDVRRIATTPGSSPSLAGPILGAFGSIAMAAGNSKLLKSAGNVGDIFGSGEGSGETFNGVSVADQDFEGAGFSGFKGF